MRENPFPGELYATPKGRTVEVVGRNTVYNEWTEETEVIAYRFLGGLSIHIRSVNMLDGWHKVQGE